jgi:hypothetical protein
MFKPEEPSPPLTPERLAARQRLNDDERKMLAAMESELGCPLTEEEERLALEPGALIEQPRPRQGRGSNGRANVYHRRARGPDLGGKAARARLQQRCCCGVPSSP